MLNSSMQMNPQQNVQKATMIQLFSKDVFEDIAMWVWPHVT